MQPQARAQNRTTGNDPLEKGPFVGLIAADAIAITARAVCAVAWLVGCWGSYGPTLRRHDRRHGDRGDARPRSNVAPKMPPPPAAPLSKPLL
jgi:hypothetical protein